MGKKVKETPVSNDFVLDEVPVDEIQQEVPVAEKPSGGFFSTLGKVYESIKKSINTPKKKESPEVREKEVPLDEVPVEDVSIDEIPEETPPQPPINKPTPGQGLFNYLKESYQKQATPEEEAKVKEEALSFVSPAIKNALIRGHKQAETAEYLNPNPFGGIKKDKAFEVAQLQKEIAAIPESKEFQDFAGSSNVLDAAKAFTKDPLKIMTELTLQSLSSMASYGATRALVGAGEGAALGSVVPGIGTAAGASGGMTASLAATSLALEFSGKMLDVLQDAGVDVTDPTQLQKAFENDELMDKARSLSYKKAIPIAMFDLLGGQLAGKFTSKPAKGLLQKAGNVAKEFAVQGATGGLGEATGELAAGEKLSAGNILSEVIGEAGTAPVDIALGLHRRAKATMVNNIIDNAADTGNPLINAIIDNESKIGIRPTIQGIESQNIEGTGDQEPGSSSSLNRPEEIRSEEVLSTVTPQQEITQPLNENQNAIQEPSTGSQVPLPGEGGQNLPEGGEGVRPSQQGNEAPQESKEYQEAVDKLTKLQDKLTNLPIHENADELMFDLREARKALAKIAGEPKPGKKTGIQNRIESMVNPKQEPVKVNAAAALKEQIKAHYRNVETGVKKGRQLVNDLLTKITDVSKEHKLTGAQMKTLVNKVKGTNLFTPGSQSKLNTFIDKVANDADFAEQLDQAETLRDKVKKIARGNKATKIHTAAKAFAKIDPSSLGTKLSLYNTWADEIVNHYKNPTSAAYSPATAIKIQAFTNEVNASQIEDKIKEVRDEFGFGKEVNDEEILKYLENEESMGEDPFAENKTEGNKKAIRTKIQKIAEYAKIGLEESDFGDKEQKAKITTILKTDLDKMSNSQLIDYIRTVNNMVANEDFADTDKLVARSKAIDNADKLRTLIGDAKLNNLGGLKSAVYSLPQIFKAAYKQSELAAEAYRLSGLGDYYNATAKVESQEDDQYKSFKKMFDGLKQNFKNFDKAQTQVDAGVFGTLVRFPKDTDPNVALAKSKYNVEESITRLKENGHEEIAKDVEDSYAKFKDAKSIEEVFTIMKDKSPAAFQMWRFWNESFQGKILNRLKKIAAEFHNSDFVEEENYTPKKFVTINRNIKQGGEKTNTLDQIGQRQQSVTAKAATNTLNENQAIDFNFYENMFQGFRESLYDIEATRPQQQLYEFMKLPESKELLGGKDNHDAIVDNWMKSDLIARSFGGTTANQAWADVSHTVASLSYIRALGGFLQFPKQYASVMVNTIGNLGTDAGLFFSAKIPEGSEKLFNQYTIGQRGRRLGGVEKGEAIRHGIQSAYSNRLVKALGKVNALTEKGSHIFLAALRAGDVSVAQRSWAAYYLQSLKKSGVDIKNINLADEAELQDQEVRQKAAAYAEQKVKETQLSSNPEELGRVLKSVPGAETALKNLLIPFSSFSINSKIRFMEGINRVRQEPGNATAYRELGSTVAEMAAFSYMKYYVLQQAMNTLVKPMIESMFDLKGEKKKEKEEDEFRFKQFYSDLLKEALPTTIGSIGTSTTVGMINWVGYLIENPNTTFSEWEKKKNDWIYNYHSKNPVDLGLYSVGLESVANSVRDTKMTYDILRDNPVHISNEYGGPDMRVSLNDAQKKFMVYNNLFDMMSTSGFMDADLFNMVQKIKREQIKKGEKKASEKGYK